jgi:hypothetical protein
MKKLFVILACMVAATSASYAQGTLVFNTRLPGVVDLRVNGPGAAADDWIGGDTYTAQIWAGPANAAETALQAVSPTTTMRTGNGAGYVVPPAGALVIPGVPGGGTASIQLRVWNNKGGTITSYDAALADPTGEYGFSRVVQVGPLGDPNAIPPTTPVDLGAFGTTSGFATQVVPEPTTIALGLLGAVALMLRRRK